MVPGQQYAFATRVITSITLVALSLLTWACGSTSVESGGPTGVRCAASLNAEPATVSPDGGNVVVTVSAARDCTWSARSDVGWIQVRSTSGQGDASFSATVARNESISARSGGIVVNDQRIGVTQEGRGCSYTVTGPSDVAAPTGERRSASVSTLSGCAWTATSSASWLVVLNPNGSGPATLTFDVLPNTGATRQATITVATSTYLVTQSAAPAAPPCEYSIDPPGGGFPASGGQGAVAVTTDAACSWTVEGGAEWTTILTAGGTGSGTVQYTVGANTTVAPRTTTLTIAGRVHTVTQAGAACTFSLTPPSRQFAATAGAGTVDVTAAAGCAWTASSNAGWLTVTTISGSGPGTVGYTLQANPDPAQRTAAILIGGQTHTVVQAGAAPPCTFALDPASRDVASAAAAFTVRVNTNAGCAWTATSNVPWLTITTGTGTGPGDAAYSVAENTTTAARTGIVTINGQTHTVNQAAPAPPPPPPCTYALSPPERTFAAAGGPGTVHVTTGPTCAWTAVSSDTWVVVTTPNGTGPADIAYTVASAAAGVNRVATITVNGQVHTVRQGTGTPSP